MDLQTTFESCLDVLDPGCLLSSPGARSDELEILFAAIHAGLCEHEMVTSRCPRDKERTCRSTYVIGSNRVDFSPLVTHPFALDYLDTAQGRFVHERDGVSGLSIAG